MDKLIAESKYHADSEEYARELAKIYAQYPDGIFLDAEYAQFIQENQLRLLIRLARYNFVTKLLSPSDSILEVGCGSGLGTIFLGQHCLRAVGMDVSETEVASASCLNRRGNVSFAVGDIFEAKQDSTKFDVTIALDVIEHMNPETGRLLLQRMVESTKDNGLVVIGSPSTYSYEHQSAISRASHVHCYDLPELREALLEFCPRVINFQMNDETVHTGHYKMAWYYFVIGFVSQRA